jgi:hypothetical protein
MTGTGDGRAWVRLVVRGRDGFIVATTFRTAVVVGKARRFSGDGEPAQWRAWLWPEAGIQLGDTPSFPVEGPAGDVQRALRRRYDEEGAWWK